MAKKNWWIVWLCAMILLVISVTPVFAASATADPGFKVWSGQKTTALRKAWTISFSAPLAVKSVNSNTVYVTDSKQAKFATKVALAEDGRSVTVTPSKDYEDGDYNLYILKGIESESGAQLEETIIMPFTVVKPSVFTPQVEIVVTVTDDLKVAGYAPGALTLEGTNGSYGLAYDESTKKYRTTIYEEDDYYLKHFYVSDGVMNTQTMKLNTIKMPKQKNQYTEAKTTKTVSFVVSSKEGLEGGKSGAIGGGTTYPGYNSWMGQTVPRAGVNVEVYNSTTTWTTQTDLNGDYRIYLPTGSYTLIVYGNGTLYKNHTYTKMTVSSGQMATPSETVNVEEPIGNLGLVLDPPVLDAGSGTLSGIDADTQTISGEVNSDATVKVYDLIADNNLQKALYTAKPDKNGKFTLKLSGDLKGKRLLLRVEDPGGNVYSLTMSNVIT